MFDALKNRQNLLSIKIIVQEVLVIRGLLFEDSYLRLVNCVQNLLSVDISISYLSIWSFLLYKSVCKAQYSVPLLFEVRYLRDNEISLYLHTTKTVSLKFVEKKTARFQKMSLSTIFLSMFFFMFQTISIFLG